MVNERSEGDEKRYDGHNADTCQTKQFTEKSTRFETKEEKDVEEISGRHVQEDVLEVD